MIWLILWVMLCVLAGINLFTAHRELREGHWGVATLYAAVAGLCFYAALVVVSR